MGDNTQTQTGGLFTNPNQEPVTTPDISAVVPEITPSVFQSIDQTASATSDVSIVTPETAIVSETPQAPIESTEPVSMIIDSVMPIASEPTTVVELVAIAQPEPVETVSIAEPVTIAQPEVVSEVASPIEPIVQTSLETAPAPIIEPAAPEIKSHVGDPISLGSLGEFAGINLGSLIQSASSSAVSTSTPQPAISPEASKTKKIVLIAMSVVGLLLLVGAGVWMMSVMDPLAGQDTGTSTDTGAIASGDIVSGTQGGSQVLSGGELTGTELTGAIGEPVLENTGNSTEPSIIDPLTNGGTNNAALVDTKQISEAINAKMKAAYEVAKTAKSASNLEAAKKALLAYGMMKKMLTKLENGEYTTNDQAFTELSEYQSQVDAATQLMNGN